MLVLLLNISSCRWSMKPLSALLDLLIVYISFISRPWLRRIKRLTVLATRVIVLYRVHRWQHGLPEDLLQPPLFLGPVSQQGSYRDAAQEHRSGERVSGDEGGAWHDH